MGQSAEEQREVRARRGEGGGQGRGEGRAEEERPGKGGEGRGEGGPVLWARQGQEPARSSGVLRAPSGQDKARKQRRGGLRSARGLAGRARERRPAWRTLREGPQASPPSPLCGGPPKGSPSLFQPSSGSKQLSYYFLNRAYLEAHTAASSPPLGNAHHWRGRGRPVPSLRAPAKTAGRLPAPACTPARLQSPWRQRRTRLLCRPLALQTQTGLLSPSNLELLAKHNRKQTAAPRPAVPVRGPRENEHTRPHEDLHTDIHSARLRNSRPLGISQTCPAGEGTHKSWCSHTVICSWVMDRDEQRTHAARRPCLRNHVAREGAGTPACDPLPTRQDQTSRRRPPGRGVCPSRGPVISDPRGADSSRGSPSQRLQSVSTIPSPRGVH